MSKGDDDMAKTNVESVLHLQNLKNSRDYGAGDGSKDRTTALAMLKVMATAYDDDASKNDASHYWTDDEIVTYLRSFTRAFAAKSKGHGNVSG